MLHSSFFHDKEGNRFIVWCVDKHRKGSLAKGNGANASASGNKAEAN